jgi:hypothetical protein
VKARRITEITTQTDEAVIIRRHAGSAPATCTQCGPDVPMITPEEAAVLFRVGVRSIYRTVETGQLHFQENSAGVLTVCLSSLQKAAPLLFQDASSQIQKNQIQKNKEIQS